MARGLNNNNPGNIVKGGTPFMGEEIPSPDKRFKRFKEMRYGYRAMFVLLKSYREIHGCDTIRKVIGRWAPPTENDTGAYVRFVSRETGVNPDTVFDWRDKAVMIRLVSAISRMENGVKPDEEDVEEGWMLFDKGVRP